MAKFIEVTVVSRTSGHGTESYGETRNLINLDKVIAFGPQDNEHYHSTVVVNSEAYLLKETYEEIKEMINR